MAADREQVAEAYAGDIIGIHNHGGLQIGDSFSTKEAIQFCGIPNFAPELFQRVRLQDPLKMKALNKGLDQLSEEGATQVFRPTISNDLILGAVGSLQFDVVKQRLKDEYNVECIYEAVNVVAARWLRCTDKNTLEQFKKYHSQHIAIDGGGHLAYLAPSMVNLNLTIERNETIVFEQSREH